MSDGRPLEIPRDALGALCRRYGVRELRLFGSAARGELGPESDVDLLVSFDANAAVGFFALARLQRELGALLGRDVDLVPEAGLKPLVRSEVVAQARVLYAA